MMPFGEIGAGFDDEADSASHRSGHEPVGYSTITDRAFDALDDAGWRYNKSDNYSIVTDETSPGKCCSAAEARYPEGFGGGRSPMVTWRDAGGSREIYISFHLKLSSNWQGHRSGVNKLGFVWIHDHPAVYFSAQGSGSSTLRPRIRLQNTPDGGRNLKANVGDASVERGAWHRWEIQMISNTPGRPDGIARLWLDGELISEHTDVLFSGASEDNRWQELSWYPVWGGRDDAVREAMSLRISDYYASVR